MTLLRLAIECSRCGRKPRRRIYPVLRELMQEKEDDEPVETWRCHGCGEIHIVTAKVYKEAA